MLTIRTHPFFKIIVSSALFFSTLFFCNLGFSQEVKPLVYHLTIDDSIDPRTSRYLELGLEKAKEEKADYVILEIDTYGGALQDADDMRTRILNFDIPVFAFINKDAASAGALISIACDSIYMAAGASIGAATVVTQDGDAAPDKYQSYMRSIMRSTAEATGRNPQIAEAMVDEDIDLPDIATEGKVLTLSTSEAIKHGFCEAQLEDIAEILQRQQLASYDLKSYELENVDKIIAFVLNPFISGILILIIIGGIYFELQTPGVGFPILASIVALVMYFIPYYLNGLAENWELLLFFLGIILIVLEIFVIPGFGVAGIGGIICTIGALVLMTLNNDVFDFTFVGSDQIFVSFTTVITGLFVGFILMFFLGVKLTETTFFKKIALVDTQQSTEGYTTSHNAPSLIGKKGIAHTVMRPSGKIMINNLLYDASTQGDYIAKETKVQVISVEGNNLKVKKTT